MIIGAPTKEELETLARAAYEAHSKGWAIAWKQRYGIEPTIRPWAELDARDRLPWLMMLGKIGPMIFDIAVVRYQRAIAKLQAAAVRIVKRKVEQGADVGEALRTAIEAVREMETLEEREANADAEERRRTP